MQCSRWGASTCVFDRSAPAPDSPAAGYAGRRRPCWPLPRAGAQTAVRVLGDGFTIASRHFAGCAVAPVLDAFYQLGQATEVKLRHEVGGWLDALASGRLIWVIAGGDAPAAAAPHPRLADRIRVCVARSIRWRASTNRSITDMRHRPV